MVQLLGLRPECLLAQQTPLGRSWRVCSALGDASFTCLVPLPRGEPSQPPYNGGTGKLPGTIVRGFIMASYPRSSSPLVFTIAAQDEERELLRAFDVVTECRLRGSGQRGVFVVEVSVWHISQPTGSRPVVSYEARWPNSTPSTFEAHLYQVWHRVARMVEAWHQARSSEDSAR